MAITNQNGVKMVKCWMSRYGVVWGVSAMLGLAAGCDPCNPNPCPEGQVCRAGDDVFTGECFKRCETDADCADEDPCNFDFCLNGGCSNRVELVTCFGAAPGCPCDDLNPCTVNDMCPGDAFCEGTPIECPPGEVCDPATGMCVGEGGGATGLLGATGSFSGSSTCGDSDDMVSLAVDGGTLFFSGFEGNDDIALTLPDDNTATAANVTAFGVPGHDATFILNSDGTIALGLVQPETGASCNATLTPK